MFEDLDHGDPDNQRNMTRLFRQSEDAIEMYGDYIPELELAWLDNSPDPDDHLLYGETTRRDGFWDNPQPQEEQPWTTYSKAYHHAAGLQPGQPEPPDFFDFLPRLLSHPLVHWGSVAFSLWLIYCAIRSPKTLRDDEKRQLRIEETQERLFSQVDALDEISLRVDLQQMKFFEMKYSGVKMPLKYSELDEQLQQLTFALDKQPTHPMVRNAKRELIERIAFLHQLIDRMNKRLLASRTNNR